MMRHLTKRLGRSGWTLILALAILLVSSQTANAQFPAYGGGGMVAGYPGFGFGMGYPGMGYGYPIGGYGIGPYGMDGFGGMGYGGVGYGGMGYGGMGYGGMGYGGMGYGGMGYGGMGYGMGYGGFGYGGYGYGYPNIYAQTSPLYNPLFGVGLTPLGAQSYMVETQLFGRRSRR
jgi:hypothetical protein